MARFVYVAGRQDEIRSVRDNHEAYGRESFEWRPFAPALGRPIGALSLGTAAEEDLYSERIPVDGQLIDHLRDAESENSIVLLIVDPWSVLLEPYRRQLEKYDQENFINCCVLVPWNISDSETQRQEAQLRRGLREAMSRTYVMKGFIRDSINGADELRHEMIVAVNEIRRRISDRGMIFQPVPVAAGHALPQIVGPGGGA